MRLHAGEEVGVIARLRIRPGYFGDGDSLYKGWLSAARYDFPIKLAPKGANGFDRCEIFAHVVAESFQPGDYYDSSKPAYFIRWEVSFKF